MKQFRMITFLFGLFAAFAVSAVNFEMKNTDPKQYDFKIRDIEVERLEEQTVFIPPNIFLIWHALQRELDFEVGGGLDFNYLKEIERVKLTPGKAQGISFLPDFEIAWHTHPQKLATGLLAVFNPPSPADVQLAVIANYNIWLLWQKSKNPEDYLIRVKSFSEDLKRPLSVELNIVADKTGTYLYKAKREYWEPIWKQGKDKTQMAIVALKGQLQDEVAELGGQSIDLQNIDKIRADYLERYSKVANVEIKFIPWSELFATGLKVKLDVIELISSERQH